MGSIRNKFIFPPKSSKALVHGTIRIRQQIKIEYYNLQEAPRLARVLYQQQRQRRDWDQLVIWSMAYHCITCWMVLRSIVQLKVSLTVRTYGKEMPMFTKEVALTHAVDILIQVARITII